MRILYTHFIPMYCVLILYFLVIDKCSNVLNAYLFCVGDPLGEMEENGIRTKQFGQGMKKLCKLQL